MVTVHALHGLQMVGCCLLELWTQRMDMGERDEVQNYVGLFS
jgi:hypothetical protein